MSDWKKLCQLEDIPRLGSRVLASVSGDIAIFRTAEDEVFAMHDKCPHKGGPLSQGIVFGESVACPLHNWTIGLATGEAAAPDEGRTPRFAVWVDAGLVHLSASELAELATEFTRPHAGPACSMHASGQQRIPIAALNSR